MSEFIALLFLCGLALYGVTKRTLFPPLSKLTDDTNPDRDAKLRHGGTF